MLKWTASAQKLMQESSSATAAVVSLRTPMQQRRTRQQRRATIATNIDKENLIPNIGLGINVGVGLASYATSTPMVRGRSSLGQRTRNSPLVLAPLADIRNVTPEAIRTPNARTPVAASNQTQSHRQRVTSDHVYATTLPRFEDEDYSPSATVLPSGQHLALRGLLPMPLTLPFQLDPFMGNPRYFNSPDMADSKVKKRELPKKRKLDQEFAAIVMQNEKELNTPTITPAKTKTQQMTATCFSSSKMGDQTLDRLIDAILDSACKEEKKQKKSRKSFNLRRRTLLKNQNQINTINEHILSPSYAAGDDPASDLNFLICDPLLMTTPEPESSLQGTPISRNQLIAMPTPHVNDPPARIPDEIEIDNTFTLATPVRPLAQKRRRCTTRKPPSTQLSTDDPVSEDVDLPVKKYKVDTSNYFEIGLALPSIYV